MKKVISLVLVLVLCFSLAACGGSKKTKTVELTNLNFDDYLSLEFEIENFDKGQLDQAGKLFAPSFDLTITVKAAGEYTFADTVLKLVLTDKANAANMGLGAEKIVIEIDENGNGSYKKEGITWTFNSVATPEYEVMKAVSEVTGTVTK